MYQLLYKTLKLINIDILNRALINIINYVDHAQFLKANKLMCVDILCCYIPKRVPVNKVAKTKIDRIDKNVILFARN